MTGPEHYRRAEGYLEQARRLDDPTPLLAAAQVHATLALAAATAIQPSKYAVGRPEWQVWVDVTGTSRGGAR